MPNLPNERPATPRARRLAQIVEASDHDRIACSLDRGEFKANATDVAIDFHRQCDGRLSGQVAERRNCDEYNDSQSDYEML